MDRIASEIAEEIFWSATNHLSRRKSIIGEVVLREMDRDSLVHAVIVDR
jgi:hypothetical protein